MLYYCFRQNSNEIKSLQLHGAQESWESVRQRIHELHFGSFRKLVSKISLSKYLSGICYVKGFAGSFDPISASIIHEATAVPLDSTQLIVPGTCLVLCRTAPTKELMELERRYYNSFRNGRPATAVPVPQQLGPFEFSKFLGENYEKSTSLYRDIMNIRDMCRREGQLYRSEMAAVSSAFYAPVVCQAVPVTLKRASGIPSSLLRPACGADEMKTAMLDVQGNLVVYR